MVTWNGVLLIALLACGLAQVTKFLLSLVRHQQWNPKVLVQSGGMPSSHAALVAALAVAGANVGLEWPRICHCCGGCAHCHVRRLWGAVGC